ncbi:MAG: N-acyl homoserine lactonase family protein [SAR324 cluster bacterium]|nr:N-acyl homoserine lactonase family protein [SAR324 cluster bacterium]
MREETYEIHALRYAFHQRTRQENFLEVVDAHDAPMPIDYCIWLVRNEQRTVVIDTGFDPLEARKRNRPLIRRPAEALAAFGVEAARVENVVITHLHYDHAGSLGDFPQAKFHVQETEMQFATGRWMLDDAERHAYSADHVAELVHCLFDKRVVFHQEDGEIAPGITVHRMAGHTMGMQSVRVRTKRGWVLLASDASHYYEHWYKRVPFAICWSKPELLTSYDKFEALAESEDHVIPGHDPLVLTLYPESGGALGADAVRLDAAPSRRLQELFG